MISNKFGRTTAFVLAAVLALPALISASPASAANVSGYAGGVDAAFSANMSSHYIGLDPKALTLSDGSIVVASTPHDWGNGATKPLAKFSSAGVYDATFAQNLSVNGLINAVAEADNSSIVIGGAFSQVNGTAVGRVAKLSSTGAFDPNSAFNLKAASGFVDPTSPTPASVDALVFDQASQKIYVGGKFTGYANYTNGLYPAAVNFTRIGTDGTLDEPFSHQVFFTAYPATQTHLMEGGLTVPNIAVAPSGYLIGIWQYISPDGNGNRYQLVRFASDGTFDSTFASNSRFEAKPSRIAVSNSGNNLANESYLVSGAFTKYANQTLSTPGLVKLNSSGTIDSAFAANWPAATSTATNGGSWTSIASMVLEGDGKLVVSGCVTGSSCYLFRMLANGSLDPFWTPSRLMDTSTAASTLLISADGNYNILALGDFGSYQGATVNGLANLGSRASITVTLDYAVQGWSGTVSTTDQNSVSLPSNPLRAGYSFVGWKLGPNYLAGNTYTPTSGGDVVVTAVWSPNTLVVTYDSQGGTSVQTGSMTVGSPISSAPNAPEKYGHLFKGWSTSPSGGEMVSFPYAGPQTSNFTLYARWEMIATATVVFDSQNGDSNYSVTVPAGSRITSATVPIRLGYSFDGWYTAKSGGVSVLSDYAFTNQGTYTIYAHWVPMSNEVTYETQGGSSAAATSFSTGSAIGALPTVVREGYTFKAWALDPNGQSTVDATYVPAAPTALKLYAIWEPNVQSFTVRHAIAFVKESLATKSSTTKVLSALKQRLANAKDRVVKVNVFIRKGLSQDAVSREAKSIFDSTVRLIKSAVSAVKFEMAPVQPSTGKHARESYVTLEVRYTKN